MWRMLTCFSALWLVAASVGCSNCAVCGRWGRTCNNYGPILTHLFIDDGRTQCCDRYRTGTYGATLISAKADEIQTPKAVPEEVPPVPEAVDVGE
jgi:hypothetical protein